MDITVWYLSTCSTCVRILKELGLDESNASLINIKTNPVTESQLEDMEQAAGSYIDLINGRSTQFRTMDQKAKDLTNGEAKSLLLSHYSFLKRPVVRIGKDYYIGNNKQAVAAAKKRLSHV